ncbi:hypothetical protein LTR70_001451 [Exophiala xenobiotica]|uniref:Uncharacterized protein n=1 Tax=Lithohypha guttulata TaxID=1690604 RepID=A0ABR0KII7_9EURO|nr:hypothetical protein LTR24_002741 [Lithohypha guttulata]KAK5327828.1 hypothetical protein LTR70_001451 [Exophiala xenobiotica]
MSSLSGQQDAGSDLSAPAPGANQTGESLGDHGKTAETQSSMDSGPKSGTGGGSQGSEKIGGGDAVKDLSGEGGGVGGKIDKDFVEGVKGSVGGEDGKEASRLK